MTERSTRWTAVAVGVFAARPHARERHPDGARPRGARQRRRRPRVRRGHHDRRGLLRRHRSPDRSPCPERHRMGPRHRRHLQRVGDVLERLRGGRAGDEPRIVSRRRGALDGPRAVGARRVRRARARAALVPGRPAAVAQVATGAVDGDRRGGGDLRPDPPQGRPDRARRRDDLPEPVRGREPERVRRSGARGGRVGDRDRRRRVLRRADPAFPPRGSPTCASRSSGWGSSRRPRARAS